MKYLSNNVTLILLLLLTASTAIASHFNTNLGYIALVILILSGFKFLLVAFKFMELHKANRFWKILISVYLIVFITLVSILIL